MYIQAAFIAIAIAILISYFFGRQRALACAKKSHTPLHSLASYYGWSASIWCLVTLVAAYIGLGLYNYIYQFPTWLNPKAITIGSLVITVIVLAFASWQLTPAFRARNHTEKWIKLLLWIAAGTSILITLLIVASVLFEAIRFFQDIPVWDFLFGTHWSPQQADPENVGSGFGAIPLFAGTLLITLVAMIVAVPLGLGSAIYLSEYTGVQLRNIIKPILEILAGIPTVVYGFFAATVVAPLFRDFGDVIGIPIATESALAAGLVMGIMVIPFVMSLSDDILHAVPRSLREGSLALGATPSETIAKVVLPAALPGIAGAFLLAVSRAIGETMIVFMAAGLAANLTWNPLEPVTTVTAQIVMLLVGDQEFDSPQTLASFALGLTLLLVTLMLNVLALVIVRKYREKYE